MLRCSKDIVPLFVESCKQRSRDSTVSSDFFSLFPPIRRRAADRWSDYAWEQQGSNNLSMGWQPDPVRCIFQLFDLSPLEDQQGVVVSVCEQACGGDWGSFSGGGVKYASPFSKSSENHDRGIFFFFNFLPSWIQFILLSCLILFLFPVARTDSLTVFITWHGSACHTSRPCDTNESTRKRQNMLGNRREKK